MISSPGLEPPARPPMVGLAALLVAATSGCAGAECEGIVRGEWEIRDGATEPAEVVLVRSTDRRGEDWQDSSDGAFEFVGVRPGRYFVHLYEGAVRGSGCDVDYWSHDFDVDCGSVVEPLADVVNSFCYD